MNAVCWLVGDLTVYCVVQNEVNAIKWDPQGNLLASCSDDMTLKVLLLLLLLVELGKINSNRFARPNRIDSVWRIDWVIFDSVPFDYTIHISNIDWLSGKSLKLLPPDVRL